jgi:putative ABC transport system permease protein
MAAATGITVEARDEQPSVSRLQTGATAAGALLALAVLAMTVGLIRSEAAGDPRTLTATGATGSIRRTPTGATAGTLALLGAILGTTGAYLALIAWYRGDVDVLSRVPDLSLAVTLVLLPAIAVTGGRLLGGREPPTIARRPIE